MTFLMCRVFWRCKFEGLPTLSERMNESMNFSFLIGCSIGCSKAQNRFDCQPNLLQFRVDILPFSAPGTERSSAENILSSTYHLFTDKTLSVGITLRTGMLTRMDVYELFAGKKLYFSIGWLHPVLTPSNA